MADAIAVCVDPAHIIRAWPKAEGFIRSAIEKVGVSNFDDVANDVLYGSSLLWLGWDGEQIVSAGVTELNENVCTIVAYGGRREDHLLQTIENYARAEGCKAVRIVGRMGWIRVLKKYRQPYVILEKAL